MLPDDDWGYRDPGTAGGLEWTVGQPSVTADDPIGWKATRGVSGFPSEGADVSDEWGTPTIVARYGDDGVPGERGSTFLTLEIDSGNTWASAAASVDGTAYTTGDDIADALAAFGDGPQPNDYVTLYRGSFTETRVWDGAAWATVDAFLHGNLIVEGSIVADRLAANTLTATQIKANTITAAEIAANTITASQIAANTITASQIAARHDHGQIRSPPIAVTASGRCGQRRLQRILCGPSTIDRLGDTITASELAANSVTASEIAANARSPRRFKPGP